ncbi:hypothetical protein T261_3618 [Streptomyces lydicus]|nr:hypothetical protein T261_3618 [Streptomyces lydicus]
MPRRLHPTENPRPRRSTGRPRTQHPSLLYVVYVACAVDTSRDRRPHRPATRGRYANGRRSGGRAHAYAGGRSPSGGPPQLYERMRSHAPQSTR